MLVRKSSRSVGRRGAVAEKVAHAHVVAARDALLLAKRLRVDKALLRHVDAVLEHLFAELGTDPERLVARVDKDVRVGRALSAAAKELERARAALDERRRAGPRQRALHAHGPANVELVGLLLLEPRCHLHRLAKRAARTGRELLARLERDGGLHTRTATTDRPTDRRQRSGRAGGRRTDGRRRSASNGTRRKKKKKKNGVGKNRWADTTRARDPAHPGRLRQLQRAGLRHCVQRVVAVRASASVGERHGNARRHNSERRTERAVSKRNSQAQEPPPRTTIAERNAHRAHRAHSTRARARTPTDQCDYCGARPSPEQPTTLRTEAARKAFASDFGVSSCLMFAKSSSTDDTKTRHRKSCRDSRRSVVPASAQVSSARAARKKKKTTGQHLRKVSD